MSNIVTQAELLEIVPELRAMAAAAPTEKVPDALNRGRPIYRGACSTVRLTVRGSAYPDPPSRRTFVTGLSVSIPFVLIRYGSSGRGHSADIFGRFLADARLNH
jgi:hypothetical protein